MVNALTLQAGNTLVNLNQKIMQGEVLSALEEQCLGSFEEGFGEPLLAIDCGEDFYALEGIDIPMDTVSVFNTSECRNSLLEFTAEGCVLEQISTSLNPRFEIPVTGRPFPVFSGANVDYGVNGTALNISNIQPAPTGIFNCDIELSSLEVSSPANGSNCETIVNTVVTRIEELQNPE